MPVKTNNQSIIKKAWEDTWKWLLGTRLGWLVAGLVAGIVGGLLAGIIAAIVSMVVTIGIVFAIHLIITPSHLSKEIRHKFIKNNANYFSRMFGNKEKRKCLIILDVLTSMIRIENEVTDLIAGTVIALPDEITQMKRQFNEQTKVPLLPDSQALRIFLSGKAGRTIDQTIKKLHLNIMGNMPTDNQIEFFIKTRAIMDKSRFGMGARLSSQYIEYSKQFDGLV